MGGSERDVEWKVLASFQYVGPKQFEDGGHKERVQQLLCTSAEFVRLTWGVDKSLGKGWMGWGEADRHLWLLIRLTLSEMDGHCTEQLSTPRAAGWMPWWWHLQRGQARVTVGTELTNCACAPTGSESSSAQRSTDCHKNWLTPQWPAPQAGAFLAKYLCLLAKPHILTSTVLWLVTQHKTLSCVLQRAQTREHRLPVPVASSRFHQYPFPLQGLAT